jgi:hypothetical protein
MEKYGAWVLGIAFVLVAGIMLWLNYQEFVKATSNLGGAIDKITPALDRLSGQCTSVNNGLVKVG